MIDATERARPAMQYIHQLEQRVRDYQNAKKEFRAKWFALGMATGAVAVTLLQLFHFR